MKEKEVSLPVGTEAKRMIAERAELLSAILDPKTDLVVRNKKAYKKKSYWRKLSIAASISIQKLEEWKESDKSGAATYFITVRASLPSGQFMDGTGACSQNEIGYNGRPLARSIHETRATAETRAKNRAISDLMAFGEVSAEEISEFRDSEADNEPPDAPARLPANDKQASYDAIQLLSTVLPGDAERLLEAGVHEKKTSAEIEAIARRRIRLEMEAIHSQGLMSYEDMKKIGVEIFGGAKFDSLPLEQSVKLLQTIHARVDSVPQVK